MNITESSYLVKFINKIDLSNYGVLESWVDQSKLVKVLSMPFIFVQNLLKNVSPTSLLCKYIDYLILANLAVLLVAITFTPTVYQGLLVGTALGLTILKWFIVPGEGHNFTTVDVPTILYIAVALVAVAFSSYFMPSAKGLAKILTYFASYIVCTNIFKGGSWKVYFFLIVLAITGGLEALYGMYQQVSGVEALATWQDPDTIKADQNMDRIYGSLDPFNPNLLAGYLLPVLPVALGVGSLFLLKKKWLPSIIFVGISALTLLAIVCTGSRGAYIGVAAIALVVYLIAGHLIWHNFADHKYSKYLKLSWLAAGIGAVLLVFIAFMAVPALHDRVMSIFTVRGNSSNSFRMNVYLASFKMFLDNWLIGIGPGNTTFRLVYGLYMVTGFDALGAYSVPLEIAVEMGIVGLLAFGWLILVILSNAVKTFNSSDSMQVKIIIATLIAAFIGMAGQGLFDTIWYRPQVHIIFWSLIAILSCIISGKVDFSPKKDQIESK